MIAALPCKMLDEARDKCADHDVIGIDEGQFFPDLVDFCDEMANAGKIVIVAALDGDFRRKPFGSVLELVPLAESVTKLTAVCTSCFGTASFSKRIVNDTAVECIGGADKYIAVCRACFHKDDASFATTTGAGVKRKQQHAVDSQSDRTGVTITLSDPQSKRICNNSDAGVVNDENKAGLAQ